MKIIIIIYELDFEKFVFQEVFPKALSSVTATLDQS